MRSSKRCSSFEPPNPEPADRSRPGRVDERKKREGISDGGTARLLGLVTAGSVDDGRSTLIEAAVNCLRGA